MVDRKLILFSITATIIATIMIFMYRMPDFKLQLANLNFRKATETTAIIADKEAENAGRKIVAVDNEEKIVIDNNDLAHQKLHFAKNSARVNSNASLIIDNVFYRLVPQVTCPTVVRVGHLDDGGKWVCNPWRVPKNCVVFSFGVSNEVSFEQDIYSISNGTCRIHSFDNVGDTNLELFKPFNGVYRQWTISGKSDPSESKYTIVEASKNFSVPKIDFLKCDIEGSEYETFNAFFNSKEFRNSDITVCQIIIELHQWTYKIADFLRNFEKNDFYMFYKEVNYGAAKCCHEFSYIHKKCLKDYGIYTEPTHFNVEQ